MKIDCISDLHGNYPLLEGGDLLIIAGDITRMDNEVEYYDFANWLKRQNYAQKVVIGGNHDNNISKFHSCFSCRDGIEYLEDSGFTFAGVKIWGTPWSLWFEGINPHCKAFTGSEGDLRKKFALIPKDADILISHTPPKYILDDIEGAFMDQFYNCGSMSLMKKIAEVKPLINVFGHIHEHGGKIHVGEVESNKPRTVYINASILDEHYIPRRSATTLELDTATKEVKFK